MKCGAVMHMSFNKIPDNLQFLQNVYLFHISASLPVTGHPTEICKKTIREILKKD
ncbi:hypothetical protein Anas_08572, partial [Armadillidium nasatum]